MTPGLELKKGEEIVLRAKDGKNSLMRMPYVAMVKHLGSGEGWFYRSKLIEILMLDKGSENWYANCIIIFEKMKVV